MVRRVFWCVLPLLAASVVAAQPRALPVPPNVTVDGVPAIPMTLVEAVAPYGQFRQARVVAWHPVERRLVVATSFANLPQLHEVRFPGAARRQLTFFADGVGPRPGAVFGRKGESIVFQKDSARGGEANQLYRYDFDTGALTMLTDGTSRHGSPVSSPSGVIAFDSTKRNGKDRDLYVMRAAQPESVRLVAQNEGAWSALAWSPDGTAILALQNVSSSETHLWRIDAASGEKTRLTPADGQPARWSAATFGAGGKTIYALSNFGSERSRIWRWTAGTWSALTPAEPAIESFALSADGHTIAAVVDLG
ncbi:MAG: TolB family protein, partial [Vicinamibacterales bacterium]